MKKEISVKKILTKAVVGFPIGVTLLIIVYASTYFIAGEKVFNDELYQLHNINTLLSQIVYIGISGYLLAIGLYILSVFLRFFDNKLTTEHPYKFVFIFSISYFVQFVIILFTSTNKKVFSENICTLNATVMMIVIALCSLVFCIKNAIEKHLIKKINQKIKERNNK